MSTRHPRWSLLASLMGLLALISGCAKDITLDDQSANEMSGSSSEGTSEFGAGGSSAPHPGGVPSSSGGNTGTGGGSMPIESTRPSIPLDEDGAAFDLQTGRMNVRYEEFLSSHDVVYLQPNEEPLYGLPVGNGRVGAMVWEDEGLSMQVANVDSSPQSTYGCGNVRLSTSGGFDQSGSYEQRLILHEGSLRTTYSDGTVISILGAANSELLGIHIEDAREEPGDVTLALSLWNTDNLPDAGEGQNIPTWQEVSSFADDNMAGLSRGQSDSNDFGVTLAASVQGTTATATTSGDSGAQLQIAGAPSYTIWLTCASRLNASNHDSLSEAQSALQSITSSDFEETAKDYRAFWHDFWARSFVQLEGPGDEDYFTSAYYLSTYMIGAGSFGNYPMHFINGVFRATQDETKWSHAYWHWNQRDVYASFYASNHPEIMRTFNNLYIRNTEVLRDNASNHWGIDGIWAPETMGWDGNADPSIYSDYTDAIHTTGTEAALGMIDYALYTGDRDYLRSTAYPFLREVVKFYAGILSYDSSSGTYFMESSHAHETYWNVPNAITDLLAIRALFPWALELSEEYGLDAELRPTWQAILDGLVDYSMEGGAYLPHQPPISQTRNNENVACEIIWPYGLTGIDASDYEAAVQTWNVRPHPYGNVWSNDAIQAARLGMGEETFQGLRTMLQRYQNYPNGMTNNTNGVFEYLGVHLIALNEALLQSHDGTVRVFPAVPVSANSNARFMLLSKGAFLVSSELVSGVVKYVGLRSLVGNEARVKNPWGQSAVRVVRGLEESEVLQTSSDTISFPTDPGAAYVIERIDEPLSGWAFSHVTGEPNPGAKSLSGTDSSLGLGAR